MIQRYLDDIEKVIGYHPTILSSTLQKRLGPDGKTIYLTGSIMFTDLSVLELAVFAVETRNKIAVDKYRFQYMDKKGRMAFRYDNAPHHREASTFPHHKHLPDRVIPSTQPSLADILNEISAVILGT
jgi:hypothetical protein